jgi:hypothetical protein
MIGITIDRQNKVHLVDCVLRNGSRYSVCGLRCRVGDIINYFQMDGTIPDVCRNCHEAYNEMYMDDLNNHLRTVRSSTIEKNLKHYLEIQAGQMDTEGKYWYLQDKDWDRLNVYWHLLNRNPYARKYGNGRKRK